MRRSCTLVLLVLAAGLASGVAAADTAADPGTNPAVACSQVDTSDGRTVIGLTPAGETLTGEQSLYPGTQLFVVVCEEGGPRPTEDGTLWNLAESDGLRTVAVADRYVAVTVTGGTDRVSVPSLVRQTDVAGGLAVAVQPGATATTDLTDRPVPFVSTDLADRFRGAAGNYTAVRDRVRANATRLNETAAALRSDGVSPQRIQTANATLGALAGALPTLHDRRAAATRPLFTNARRHESRTDARRSAAAMDAVEGDAVATRQRASDAVATYTATVAALNGQFASAVRTNLLLGLVAGVVVGLVVGAAAPLRAGREALHYWEVSSQTSYERSVLRVPLAVAALAAVAAVVLAVVGGFGVLEVILP